MRAMRLVGDEEGEGDDEKDGVGDKGGVRRRGRWRRLQERWHEGDGRVTATRAMATAMAMAKATTWVMVMVTRRGPCRREREGKSSVQVKYCLNKYQPNIA